MKPPKYNVLLPKTNFPMKADLPKREPLFQAQWENLDVYKRRLEKNRGKNPFVLHDGPPYANGRIHMGHALNKILKDIIVKYKASRGFYSPYIPGWDCHGLPIEHQLMKEKGWDKRKVSRVVFRQEAAKYAEHFISVQKQDFKRLGILGDWDHPYKTMAPDYEAGIARTFYDLLEKGAVYRDKKPVYWCPSCETALAEAEVEYEDKTDASVYVKFPILEWPPSGPGQALGKDVGRGAFVLVWTTTPWTFPANVALAFNPEQNYKVYKTPSGEKILAGEPGLKFLEETFGPIGSSPLPGTEGLNLEGLVCKNPLNGRDSVGILADFVSNQDGAGVVHIAPGHGAEDYAVGRDYGLEIISPVDESGKFTPQVSPVKLAGLKIWDANAVIVEELEKSRHLVKKQDITHSYPHCWRCKSPIIFRATEQWFLKVDDDFRRKLLDSADRVEWIPDYGKERILGMLKTRPDWCLSRQRFWGVPIPMFFCEGCKEPLRDKKVFDHVVDLFRKHGSDVWYEKEAKDILSTALGGSAAGERPSENSCAKCRGTSFRKEEDILDVWFDSGVSWVSVLKQRPETQKITRENVMYLEGSDQHRGWFQTSLLPSVALTGEPPFGRVLTHGFVLDGEGRAMSKSLGNVIAPQEIFEKNGADIVRLWVAVTDYRQDVRLSQNILDRVIDTYRKIRNTLRFLVGNISDFNPTKDAVSFEEMEDLDLAALNALNKLIEQARGHYDAYEFHQVAGLVCDNFCINLLSEYYLDVLKDVLYCDKPDSPRRRSAQTAFLHIAKSLAKIISPLLSFTAEEVWRTLKDQNVLDTSDEGDSVFLNDFPELLKLPKGKFFVMADFLSFRRKINEALEKSRQAGTVKGANDAHVFVSIHDGHQPFASMSDETLAAYLGMAKITSRPSTSGEPVDVTNVEKAPGDKCARCWIWKPLVQDGLCARCAQSESVLRA